MINGVEDRFALELALRERGEVGLLADAAIHNVGLETDSQFIYGRNDWIRHETQRCAELGKCQLSKISASEAALGAGASLCALHWTTSAGNKTVGAASLSIVHRRRIVREWQVHDRWSLANAESSAAVSVAQGILSGAAQRFRIPWEYGETRVTLAQASPDSLPTAVAPPALAGHRLAILWHQLWNLRMSAQETEGYAPGSTIHWPGQRMPSDELQSTINLLLAPFADPAMFVERIIASSTGIQAALQWRLVGRHVQSAWGVPASGHRLTLKGLSFFELIRGKIRSEHCCFDLLTLLEQLALREAR